MRAEARKVAAETARPAGPDRPRVLLVKEDDTAPRSVASQLEQAGIEVSTAGSIHDAIGAVTCGAGELDLILCDLHLAGGGGIRLYHFLESEYPGMEQRMVFLRRAALSPRENEFLRTIDQPVLELPCWLDGLTVILRAWTARRRGRSGMLAKA